MFTNEEEELIKRASAPPKCMHDPKYIESHEVFNTHYWRCSACGMFARGELLRTPNIGHRSVDLLDYELRKFGFTLNK